MWHIAHYGVGHLNGGNSGRYKWGSGNRPYQRAPVPIIKDLKNVDQSNYEKWGEDQNSNILYITGLSGSGKSTIAEKLADKNTDIVYLDSVYNGEIKGENLPKSFKNYLNKNMPNYKKLDLSKKENQFDSNDKEKASEYGKLLTEFEKNLENYGEEQYKNNRKVIAEGVQIFDSTLYQDKNYYKDKPLLIMKTNSLQSLYRQFKRDEFNDYLPYLNEYIKDAKLSSKMLKDLRNTVNTKNGLELIKKYS